MLQHSTYLAQRWEDEGGVNLYYLAAEGRDFFGEVGVDEKKELPVVLRSISSAVPLQDYAHYVRRLEGQT